MVTVRKLLDNTVILSYSLHAWGNRRKAPTSKVNTDADKSRLSLSKHLLKNADYDAIISFYAGIRAWLAAHSVPSYFRNGLQLVSVEGVDEIDAYLMESETKLADLVAKFQESYNDSVQEASSALGDLFNPDDYPPVSALAGKFYIRWHWIRLGVADSLPSEVRERESKKLEEAWERSISEIQCALRQGFKELVDHAVDRLTCKPGEKPKILRESVINNFREFIDTFDIRNIVKDDELASLVEKARVILSDTTASDLRESDELRTFVADRLGELKSEVDAAVVSATRAFDFEDE